MVPCVQHQPGGEFPGARGEVVGFFCEGTAEATLTANWEEAVVEFNEVMSSGRAELQSWCISVNDCAVIVR